MGGARTPTATEEGGGETGTVGEEEKILKKKTEPLSRMID